MLPAPAAWWAMTDVCFFAHFEADMRPVVEPRNAALADMIAAHQRRINAPARPMGTGHLVFQRFIKTDHRLNRRGFRLPAAINFLLCAALFKLTSRWLRQSATSPISW